MPLVPSHELNRILIEQGRHPGRTLVIAHRGASAEAPENTLAALDLAAEIGADAVEFDVRATLDDHLVLMHDEKVDRTTDGRGYVASKTIPEIRVLDAGRWFRPEFRGERIPTLLKALRVLSGRSVPVVEIKDEFDKAPWVAEAVVRALVKSGVGASNALVIARDQRHLAAIKKESPLTPVAIVTVREHEALGALEKPVDGCFAFWPSTSPDLVRAARTAGNFFVCAWTVDGIPQLRSVTRCGVDALVTNDPRRALALFGGPRR